MSKVRETPLWRSRIVRVSGQSAAFICPPPMHALCFFRRCSARCSVRAAPPPLCDRSSTQFVNSDALRERGICILHSAALAVQFEAGCVCARARVHKNCGRQDHSRARRMPMLNHSLWPPKRASCDRTHMAEVQLLVLVGHLCCCCCCSAAAAAAAASVAA